MILSNLGIFGDNKVQNLNIFLECGVCVWGCVLLWWWLLSCPLVQRCAGFRCFRTCRRLALVLEWCAPCLLSALLHCACRVACEYGSISRFKGVLRGFWGVGVYSYGFGVLRGLCGFCARVELGGYMTCGVFASILSSFVLFCPLLSSFLSFCSCVCLSFYLFAPAFFVCPLVLCLSSLSLWVVVSFSLSDYAQKRKGAPCWCVLSCPVVGCGFVMQNMASRSRKIRNRWSRFLRQYIHLSKYIRNPSATARKNLREYSRQIPAR